MEDNDKDDNNNKDDNNDKGISALGLERPGIFVWMTLMTSLLFLYHLTKNLPNQNCVDSHKLA